MAPIFGIRPSVIECYDDPELHEDTVSSIGELTKKAFEEYFSSLMGSAELDIKWGNIALTIDGTQARWKLSDLFESMFRGLDEYPQETEDTANELLPVLKSAVEELERRLAQQGA
jgi:hypothetical protein